MKEQCNDCGRILTTENTTPRLRKDLCNECWNLRGDFIRAFKEGKITLTDFQRVQKAMRGSSHAAYSLMRSLLGSPL